MGIILTCWRFEGEPPLLERVVEAFRERYAGEVNASFDSHETKISPEEMSDEEKSEMQLITEDLRLRMPSAWRSATISTTAGRIELHCSAGEVTISAKVYTMDEAVCDALDGAMESVGGMKQQAGRQQGGAARPSAQSLITGRSRTLLKVFAYSCYAGIVALLLLDKVGFLGAFGLLVLTWIIRFALTLAIGIRRARFMFTQILQQIPQPNTGAPKSVESRVVESTEVKPQN